MSDEARLLADKINIQCNEYDRNTGNHFDDERAIRLIDNALVKAWEAGRDEAFAVAMKVCKGDNKQLTKAWRALQPPIRKDGETNE